MSNNYFDPNNQDPHLTFDERRILGRLLSHPEDFPNEFWSGVYQKVALNGEPTPHSQVQGLSRVFDQVDSTVATLEALSQIEYEYASGEVTTTAGYEALSGGPDIAGLDDGTYLALAIAYAGNNLGDAGAARFKIRLNGGDTGVSGIEGISYRSDSLKDNVSIAAVVVASAGAGANTIEVQYAKTDAAGTARFDNRFLIVMRVA